VIGSVSGLSFYPKCYSCCLLSGKFEASIFIDRYMIALIFFKYSLPWQAAYNTCFAPSIINVFINMALKPGQYDAVVDPNDCASGGVYPVYGDIGGSEQSSLQSAFLLVAFMMVPVILLPKPIFLWLKTKREKGYSRHGNDSDPFIAETLLADHDVKLKTFMNFRKKSILKKMQALKKSSSKRLTQLHHNNSQLPQDTGTMIWEKFLSIK
jgi:V-type ATPase 116kDa subunit family